MLKYLRIAVTALCLTACVLIVALWVRSYWRHDSIRTWISSSRSLVILSHEGFMVVHLRLYNFVPFDELPLVYFRSGTIGDSAYLPPASWSWRSGFIPESSYFESSVPHWILLIVSGSLAIVPWIHWSKRFSLRTLLIATTLVAMGLGIIIWAARLI
jgi:hypothetical protein